MMRRLRRPYFGRWASVEPLSRAFGYDRGTPVDRYYIEGFLDRRRADIRGRVMEIGEPTYSQAFGGSAVTRQDVLHVHEGNPVATIVGDLTVPGVLPDNVFDCHVITQTLHCIYDMAAAVRQLHASLAPGGVALVTVPGISPVDVGEWGGFWCWSLTETSARRLFAETFGEDNVEVETFGNLVAATALLRGAAAEELGARKLDVRDPAYPVTITVRARKA